MAYYNKKSIWKWIILYIVIGVIVYGVIYYFFFVRNGTYTYKPSSYQDIFSSLNRDVLLHKLFPNLTFNNGIANLPNSLLYEGDKLYLKDSQEDYFTNNKEKSLLLTVELDGIGHVDGLFHSYLGVFDKKGNLLTPLSSFGKDLDVGQGSYDFYYDKAHFGGDAGKFSFLDCKGVKYILFISSGCPNSTCCSDQAKLFRVNNGEFKVVQTIDGNSLNKEANSALLEFLPIANAAIGPDYGLKMIFSNDTIVVKKLPFDSSSGCPESNYKNLNWNRNTCTFN